MAFQLKDFSSIAASMVNYMRATTSRVTDFNPGSVARTLLESVAIEIEELYQNFFHGVKEAIPVSLYTSLDFDALSAIPASGMVRVSVTASAGIQTIPANTVFSSVGLATSYMSQEDVVVPAGNTYVDVRVVASVPGMVGNIAAGKQFQLTPAIPGMVSAENQAAFRNGSEAENEADRKARFRAYILALSRGTVSALEYGLKTAAIKNATGVEIERVKAASVIEPYKMDPIAPVAWVKCYIHNGTGQTSGELVARAAEVLHGYYDENGQAVPGWKAAGVKVEVFAAAETPVDVAGTLTEVPGYDKAALIDQAQQLVYGYLLGLNIGESAVKAEIISMIQQLEGVYNIVLPDLADVINSSSQAKLMPGNIAIN